MESDTAASPPRLAAPAPAESTGPGRWIAALLAGATSLGMAPIFVRWSRNHGGVGAVATGFWRVLLAVPLLIGWLGVRRKLGVRAAPTRADRWAIVAAIGAGVFFGIDLGLYHLAVERTSVANATMFSNCAPIFVALAAWMLLKERFGGLFVGGLVLAMAGAAALSIAEGIIERPDSAERSLEGDVLAAVSAVFYAGYQLCIKRARQSMDTPVSMTISGAASVVTMGLIALALGETFIPSMPKGWWILIGVAVGVHLGGQCVIVMAMGRLPVSFTTVGLLFQPIVAAVFGWWFVGEGLGWLHIVGAACVLTGIYMARRGSTLGQEPRAQDGPKLSGGQRPLAVGVTDEC
ncbi:MAG: DMT family transporter [Planctomycetota bacterium]|jgi:drug/metabolite transporter (DMT)-like permease